MLLRVSETGEACLSYTQCHGVLKPVEPATRAAIGRFSRADCAPSLHTLELSPAAINVKQNYYKD